MNDHGGNVEKLAARLDCQPADILDFSANINPLGPPEYIWNVLARSMSGILHYPDPEATVLTRALARQYRLQPEQIVVGNGTSELLFALVRALDCRRAVIPVPAYIDYRRACEQAGIPVCPVVLDADNDFKLDAEQLAELVRPGDLVIIGQPNNPTGQLLDPSRLLDFAGHHPEVFFVVDEAFAGFVREYSSLAGCLDNCLVLCSLTKLFAIPGLRLGFLAASGQTCDRIRGCLSPWSVNTLAQAAGAALAGDRDYVHRTRTLVAEYRQQLVKGLKVIAGLRCFPSTANFILVRLADGSSATRLAEVLLQREKIALRVCDNYEGLDDRYFRVAVRSNRDNDRLVTGLRAVLEPGLSSGAVTRKKRPSLMLQGTGSDVGKSILVAGLCRVLLQDGVRVAPFKAQNMSLNSYVTRDGGEMGRAQVVQAQACRLDPDVRMNPVLLKPSSDVGSQVIIHGKPVGNMKVLDYVKYKQLAWQQVCQSYDRLVADFDCVVLEGAGSPGEVNLKSHDIVNMRMARYAESPVLLVGDIDRGGVYASFIGHVEVMLPWERELLAGFVVNRFRGDATLLDDAHRFLEERTARPVLGVIPYLRDLGLPQEDSVSFKAGLYDSRPPQGEHVDIALIDLPHISNFTDFEPLLIEPDVYLRIVRRQDELGRPDCIILPGSKNVVADRGYLEATGLGPDVIRCADHGTVVVGICGGFQMLGRMVLDPHGLEGAPGGKVSGLGLLELDTELAAQKRLIQRQGIHVPSGQSVYGYEIHHGRSSGAGGVLEFSDGTTCGAVDRSGRVWGCYLHGIFDSDAYRRWFINGLRRKKGLPDFCGQTSCYDLEPALDRLAAVLRQHLDMDRIYALLGL